MSKNNTFILKNNDTQFHNALINLPIKEKIPHIVNKVKLLSRKYMKNPDKIDGKNYISDLQKIFEEMFDELKSRGRYTLILPKPILNNIKDKDKFYSEVKSQISSFCDIDWE